MVKESTHFAIRSNQILWGSKIRFLLLNVVEWDLSKKKKNVVEWESILIAIYKN